MVDFADHISFIRLGGMLFRLLFRVIFLIMNPSAKKLTWSAAIAKRLIEASQGTRFRGMGGYSPEAFVARGQTNLFPQAKRESSLYADFFDFFAKGELAESLNDRDVLDFGCGYGGRTVEYARRGHARFVWGVEPIQTHIDLAKQYASSQGIQNVDFRLCGQTEIPIPNNSVDVVVSYDVLEHVSSPPHSISELFRVLRPGGVAYLVFPVYFGMRSHHLDYITTFPGLHWIFSANSLVQAVNQILRDDRDMTRFGTREQPAAKLSFDNRRYVLPLLNGLSGRHLKSLFSKFASIQIERHVVLRSKLGLRAVTRTISSPIFPMSVRDAVTDSVSCVLKKRD